MDLGRNGVFLLRGHIQDPAWEAGADKLDDAAGGDNSLYPSGEVRRAAPLGDAADITGAHLRRRHNSNGTCGGADSQRVAGDGRVGLLQRAAEPVGTDMPALLRALVLCGDGRDSDSGLHALLGAGRREASIQDFLMGGEYMILPSRFMGEAEPSVPVGTSWIITENTRWVVPATGDYQVELHGGGGGGAQYNGYYGQGSAGGGGSGQIYTISLLYGETVDVSIGAGGIAGSGVNSGGSGGATTFGTLNIEGGGGGSQFSDTGTASGALATAGQAQLYGGDADGGLGNRNMPNQIFGNGGSVVNWQPQPGQSGAALVTFLGQ